MNNLIKLQANETGTIYILDEKLQGLVSVPNDLKNSIKVFMLFKASTEKEIDKDKVINEILEVSRQINLGEDNGICIVTFMNNNLSDSNALTYANELNNIKGFVNKIYNSLLRDGKLTKENFVKRLELLYKDDEYKSFIDFLCIQDSDKFHSNSYDELINKKISESPAISNLNNSNLSNQVVNPVDNNDIINNSSIITPTNISPVNETLSIGNIPINHQSTENDTSGGPSNNISNNKLLVKTKPNAFIKLPTVILILLMSFVIGISFSLYFLK